MSKQDKTLVGFSFRDYSRHENYKAELDSQDFTSLTRFLEGQMLTIVDASIVDLPQREAVKSLVRKALWNDVYENVQSCLFQRQNGHKYPLG